MTDLICRKSMTRCLTPGMCSPHGGCWPEDSHMRAIRSLRGDCADLIAERDHLKAEIQALRESNDKLTRRNGMLEQNVETMTDTHVLYTWLRKKCDQPSNDVVAVHMNIGHDWVPVHDLDRDLRTMIDQEQP